MAALAPADLYDRFEAATLALVVDAPFEGDFAPRLHAVEPRNAIASAFTSSVVGPMASVAARCFPSGLR